MSVVLTQIESRRSDFLCPEVGGWFGLKRPFFDPNWGQICFFWPRLGPGGQKMAILVNALSDLGSNLSFFGPNRGRFSVSEVGGWFGLKCSFFDPNWGQICFFWPILGPGGQKMAILVNALSDLGSNVSCFDPN